MDFEQLRTFRKIKRATPLNTLHTNKACIHFSSLIKTPGCIYYWYNKPYNAAVSMRGVQTFIHELVYFLNGQFLTTTFQVLIHVHNLIFFSKANANMR